jgi:methionyl-tRNA formyltransferase
MIKLMADGHEIVSILTARAAPEYGKKEKDFEEFAYDYDIPYFVIPTGVRLREGQLYSTRIGSDKGKKLGVIRADVGVSVNFPTIIERGFRNYFKYGIFNAHPSDLPRYRGNAVINWAMLRGDRGIALTIHRMEDELDAGDIVEKVGMPITQRTYVNEVVEFLNRETPLAFSRVLKRLQEGNGAIVSSPQDHHRDEWGVTRAYPRLPEDGEINWTDSAIYIDRMVHALGHPYSGAYTFIDNKKLIITKSRMSVLKDTPIGERGHIARRDMITGEVDVLCGPRDAMERVVTLEEVEFNGKKQRPSDVITTVRTRLGFDPVKAFESLTRE